MASILLNQVIAIEKGVKGRVYAEVTQLHHATQKPELLYGFSKTYDKLNDAAADLPPEQKRVQFNGEDVLKAVAKAQTELFDYTATKDFGNTHAKADVVVDDQILIAGCPVTFLLFLEKNLTDMRTFVDKIVPLDEARDWTKDPKSGFWKSEPITTHRTEKVQEGLTLAPATDKHPAQVQMITKDVIVGHWKTVHFSGALPMVRKTEIVERIDKLLHAVKSARELANNTKVDKQAVGASVFGYLFK